MSLKEHAKKIKRELPAIYLALKHQETPKKAKVLAGLTLAYALSPIDLIPDFIPVLGYLDDLILLPILISLTLKAIPDHIMQACRQTAEESFIKGIPKHWYYVLPVLVIWLLILTIIWVNM